MADTALVAGTLGVIAPPRSRIEVGDGSTFPTAGHLAAYAGLAPATRSSGSSIRGEQPSRRGNKQLKRAFFLSAFAALGDPFSWVYYDKKFAQGKHHTRALLCLARRRSDDLFAMLPTAPSTSPSRQPQSPDLRFCKENDSISLDVETEHRMAVLALRVHQHRLAQPPPDLPKEAAEHIKSILALQLPQVDVEVDFIVGKETEDRQHIGRRPDPQVRALGIRRAGQHGPRRGHRKHPLSLGVLELPALLHDKIEHRLPVLHRGIRDPHVRQRPHQVQIEETLHVIPQQVTHPAMLPRSPPHRPPFPLTKEIGAPATVAVTPPRTTGRPPLLTGGQIRRGGCSPV